MKRVVGMAEYLVSANREDSFVTFALGSCLGITVYDPMTHVGGMLHVMLPNSATDPQRGAERPGMFVDLGVPRLFRDVYARGGSKGRLIVKVAGGAHLGKSEKDHFRIGARNFALLRRLFWKNNILINASDVGGLEPRTMKMDMNNGRVLIKTKHNEREL